MKSLRVALVAAACCLAFAAADVTRSPQSIQTSAMSIGAAASPAWWQAADKNLTGGDTTASLFISRAPPSELGDLLAGQRQSGTGSTDSTSDSDAAGPPSLFNIVQGAGAKVFALLPPRFRVPSEGIMVGDFARNAFGTAAGFSTMLLRYRVDVFAEPVGEFSRSAAAVTVTVFPPHPGALKADPRALPGAVCDATYARSEFLQAVPLDEAPCLPGQHSHPAEDTAELLLDIARFVGGALLHQLESFGVVVIDGPVEALVDAFSLPERVTALVPDYIAVRGHSPPVCSFDFSVLDPPRCVLLQCANAAACAQRPTRLTTLVTMQHDVAVVALSMWALALFTLRGRIARSNAMQLLLAAACGVLVVTVGVVVLVLQTVTNTRLGKVGAYSLFMLGGSSAVLQGVSSALWFWFSQEFRRNGFVQLGVVVCSIVSTTLCYRYLGAQLSAIVSTALTATAAALTFAAFVRNPEFTVVFWPAAGIALVSHRYVLRLPFMLIGWLLSYATRSAAAPATAQGAPGASPAVFQTPARSHRGTGDDGFNDPTDDLPPEAFTPQLARTPGPATRLRTAQYVEDGQRHTAKALEGLYAEIRQHPERYVDRLKAPDAVMRQAGVGLSSDDGDDSFSDDDDAPLSRAGSP